MSLALIVQPSAKRDIAEAHAYYAQYGRADAFVAALDQAFIQIADRPLMYPVVYEDVRRALVRRFHTRCSLSSSPNAPWCWPSITSVEIRPLDLGVDVRV
jgi:hypothetical protein